MKHPPAVVLALLALFIGSQFIGLLVLSNYIDADLTEKTGVVSYKELPAGIERPDIAPNYSFILISLAVIIGTVILLLIMKFRQFKIWKLWYFLSVFVTLSISWAAFIPEMAAWISAAVAAVFKIFKPNILIHNLTELFVYSGLAAIFVPVMNLFSATILLLLISVYDMYAVWKSKHMIALAKFQTSSNLFAGLTIPRSLPSLKSILLFKTSPNKKKATTTESVAIIGGGDIGFPLLFAGTVAAQFGFQKAAIIPIFAALGLLFLFYISKQGKFYPAMPFVSAGCFLGYGIVTLL